MSIRKEGRKMRDWIDFVAILVLGFAGVTGNFLVTHGAWISDGMILLLFGAGIFSSLILIKTENPPNIGQPPTSLRSEGGE